MKIVLSSEEMLAQWKLRRGFEPLRNDCVITRNDGVDLDQLLRLEMRDWYLNLLNTAPLNMLSTTNIANDIAIVKGGDNVGTITLPENCRRIVELQLEGWSRQAKILDDPFCQEALLQDNPYSRGGCEQPIAIKHGNRPHVYSLPSSTPKIVKAIAVMEPADGSYEMDESALSTILNSQYSIHHVST